MCPDMSHIKGTNYHPHSTAKASQWPSPSSIGKQEQVRRRSSAAFLRTLQDSLYSRKMPMTMRFISYEAHDKDMLYEQTAIVLHAHRGESNYQLFEQRQG